MLGFQPATKRAPAQKRANGGPVRGPGTGTSDDIEAEVPAGSYIMPADSTQQIGEGNLSALGFQSGKVPVALSNGEYEMPPEQVHAVGVQALDAMKGATHVPVGEQQDVEPPVFFANGGVVRGFGAKRHGYANGGLVDDERKRSNSFGDAAAAAANPGVTQVQPPPAAASAPAMTPGIRYEEQQPGLGQLMRERQAAAGAGRGMINPPTALPAAGVVAGANEAALQYTGFPLTNDQESKVISQFEQDQRDRAAGAESERRGIAPVFGISAPAPAPAPTTVPTAPSAVASPAGSAAKAPAVQPASAAATPTMPGVYRQGNSYGDSPAAAAAGFAPRSGPSAQNMAAADALEARGMAERAGQRAAADAAAARGFAPGGGLAVIGDGTQADAVRRRAIDAAGTPYAGARGQLTANQVRTLAGMDEANARNDLARETTSANNAAALQREELQQTGADTRASASNAVQAGELDLRREAQGFQTRASQRLEKLYQQYDKAKPEERGALAEQIRTLTGKEQPNRFTVVAGGQEIDPATQQLVTRPARVFNNQSGQFIDQAQVPGATLPPGMVRQVGTSGGKPVYEDAQGKRFIGG